MKCADCKAPNRNFVLLFHLAKPSMMDQRHASSFKLCNCIQRRTNAKVVVYHSLALNIIIQFCEQNLIFQM
jgi:hypothetical protein